MPAVPIGLLRGLLALLSLFFAHFLGRSIARKRRNEGKPRIVAWALRLLISLLGLWWGAGLDAVLMTTLFLCAVSLGLGIFLEYRPRKRNDDLTDVIFPEK
jgi:hypothetical protein